MSPALAQTASTMDWSAVVGQVTSGGVGGAILMIVVGVVKNMMGK
jgi:fucose permease